MTKHAMREKEKSILDSVADGSLSNETDKRSGRDRRKDFDRRSKVDRRRSNGRRRRKEA